MSCFGTKKSFVLLFPQEKRIGNANYYDPIHDGSLSILLMS